jgi:hypothetical protein
MLRLSSVVLGVLLLCVVLTLYLLRVGVAPATVTSRTPAPYRLLFLQGNRLLSVAAGSTTPVAVATLISNPGSQVEAVRISPRGHRLLLLGSVAGNGQAWLLTAPGTTPIPLPTPPARFAGSPWRYVDAVWSSPTAITLLLAGQKGQGMVEQFQPARERVPGRTVWLSLPAGSYAVSLGPTGDQVALVEAQPGSGSFAPQVAVRLHHIEGDHDTDTVALRYLGTASPAAIHWSPDGGTLVVQVPGQGLAIQKSSGKPVLSVSDAAPAVAFSTWGASLVYVAGSTGDWQLHVLNLHGNVEEHFMAPSARPPRWLAWTPDATAILYAVDATVWQIDAATGNATRLPFSLSGEPLRTVPADATFGV